MDQLVLAHIPNAMAKLLRNLPAGDATRDAAIDQFIKILKNKPSFTEGCDRTCWTQLQGSRTTTKP